MGRVIGAGVALLFAAAACSQADAPLNCELSWRAIEAIPVSADGPGEETVELVLEDLTTETEWIDVAWLRYGNDCLKG